MSKYKFQVVAHEPYYPTSALFEFEADAWEYYYKLREQVDVDDTLVTIGQIIDQTGISYYKDKIEW